LKKFGPSENLSNLESSILKLGVIPADESVPRNLIAAYETSQKGAKNTVYNKILSEIRRRFLADVVHKVIPTKTPPNEEVIRKLGFFPRYVSVEVMRMIGDFFTDQPDLVPQMVTLFTVMRQSQFIDPQALFAKNAAVFFLDCAFLSITLAMMQRDFQNEIILLRLCAERSIEHFLQLVNVRMRHRIQSVAAKSFDLGLCTSEEEAIADKAVEGSLMEIAACIREWRAVLLDTDVLMLWVSVLCDSFLKTMNSAAVSTAKAAIKRGTQSGHINTALWSVWNRFIPSVEMVLPEEYSRVTNSYKVAQRIQNALSGTISDINSITEPIPNDEQIFGISPDAFESLMQCNPVLQKEPKHIIKALVAKLILTNADLYQQGSTKTSSSGEKDFAALFNRG
jgi:hypothetical protein